MLQYIIDLKRTSQYNAANFWIDLKGQNTCKILMANIEYSNIKDHFEK